MARTQSTSPERQPASANLGFEAKLWLAADKLRNNTDAAEYKHVVLGLNFLKYITEQGVEVSPTKIIHANTTVIVARGATTGRLTMLGHAMAMNQTCYGLRSQVSAPFALYCNARHFIERPVQGGHGSIFDTIKPSTFEATDVLLAPMEVLLAFDKQVAPLFQQKVGSMSLNESIVEDAALEWCGEFGYAVGHGAAFAVLRRAKPHLAPEARATRSSDRD